MLCWVFWVKINDLIEKDLYFSNWNGSVIVKVKSIDKFLNFGIFLSLSCFS